NACTLLNYAIMLWARQELARAIEQLHLALQQPEDSLTYGLSGLNRLPYLLRAAVLFLGEVEISFPVFGRAFFVVFYVESHQHRAAQEAFSMLLLSVSKAKYGHGWDIGQWRRLNDDAQLLLRLTFSFYVANNQFISLISQAQSDVFITLFSDKNKRILA